MTQLCNTYDLNQQADRLDYFQQMILNGLRYWQEHPAIQTIDDAALELERDGILNALTRGLQFEPAWPLVRGLIERLAAYMERRGYWTPWRVVLEQAIALSQRVGDVAGETTMTALLARLSQRQSRGADVVRYYRRAMRLAKQSDNQYELARACCNLGFYYIDASRRWRAEVLSLRSLEIFECLGSEHGIAHTHNHLGLLYIQQEKWDSAEKSMKSACRIWKKNREEHNLVSGYANLGRLYVSMEQTEAGLKYLLLAEELAQKKGVISILAIIWNNIAWAFRLESEWDDAHAYATKAEASFRVNNNLLGLAQVWNNLGLISYGLGDLAMTRQYLEESLKAYRKLKHPGGIHTVQKDLARIAV